MLADQLLYLLFLSEKFKPSHWSVVLANLYFANDMHSVLNISICLVLKTQQRWLSIMRGQKDEHSMHKALISVRAQKLLYAMKHMLLKYR